MSEGSGRRNETTYTSEEERTLKCEDGKQTPYIQEGMVCAHIVFKTRVALRTIRTNLIGGIKSGATLCGQP